MYESYTGDQTLMSAAEAHRRSQSVIEGRAAEELAGIARNIRTAVSEGRSMLSHNDTISVPVLAELKRQGYSTKSWSDPREGTYTQISW